jgi:hypothetical protein
MKYAWMRSWIQGLSILLPVYIRDGIFVVFELHKGSLESHSRFWRGSSNASKTAIFFT